MSNKPYNLVEIESTVLETTDDVRVWSFGDPYFGTEVNDARKLDELVITFYFLIPESIAKGDAVSLLTVTRGRPSKPHKVPELWDSVALAKVRGGVFAHLTYEPARSRFKVEMNVGGESRKLVGVTLKGATPEDICGRLLAFHVDIGPERIFASVHEPFGGEVALDAVSLSTGGPGLPWGEPAAGHWWVFSGMTDATTKPLPSGFGLSDLRITLGSADDYLLDPVPYLGALDHLVTRIGTLPHLEEIESIPEKISEIADELDDMSGTASQTARRLGAISGMLRRLLYRLPEDPRLYLR